MQAHIQGLKLLEGQQNITEEGDSMNGTTCGHGHYREPWMVILILNRVKDICTRKNVSYVHVLGLRYGATVSLRVHLFCGRGSCQSPYFRKV
ncbi:hypothetical protein AMTR_s00057p00167570 [Amborella trichopoda]|uniref:Uncharacterized protein n=1 Tax=Amborella trichopoda TaxID=13333 RepID=U5D937_AMBTC|nr:hypothetical protein AMTR_s00057p00167570 [Amborella trichopoda]